MSQTNNAAQNDQFFLEVTSTSKKCPVGEKAGSQNLAEGKTPVLSCEGACIRGEIARLAANMIAKEEPYRRTCHGELFTVPASALSNWTNNAEKVVLVDGCFLRCHGRVLENTMDEGQLRQFDALSMYKKYSNLFDIDDVPEAERIETARFVADSILKTLEEEQNQ